MPKPTAVTGLMLIALASPAFAQRPVCVDFEPPLAVGTQYGAPVSNLPGDIVFTSNNIHVAVDKFIFSGPKTSFNLARIETAAVPFGSGQSVRTSSINLVFDFSSIGFIPRQVRFEFLDLGGIENISANGALTPFAGELSAAPATIGGAGFAVTTTPVAGGKVGAATLTGTVISLKIGGEEFWIDQVCAFP